MSLLPIDFTNNVHEGKIYYKSFVHTAGNSAITWQSHLMWLNQQFNTFLDSLPDGYYFKVIYFMGTNQNNLSVISTNGTAHDVHGTYFRRDMNSANAGVVDYVYSMNKTTLASNCFTYISHSVADGGKVTVTNKSTETCIEANDSRTDGLYYVLFTRDTNLPAF